MSLFGLFTLRLTVVVALCCSGHSAKAVTGALDKSVRTLASFLVPEPVGRQAEGLALDRMMDDLERGEPSEADQTQLTEQAPLEQATPRPAYSQSTGTQ